MKPVKNQLLPFERITREPGYSFFGYYDLQPWSADGNHHLCHRVAFADRLPKSTDRAELGMVRVHDGLFIPLTETWAWNFQQGAMLQWNPARPNGEIICNIAVDGTFKGVIRDIVTGKERVLPRAIANVDPAGRWGLSTNFSRQFDFRAGYGYAGREDAFKNEPAPADDGVFLMDLASGNSKLILSLESFRSYFGDLPPGADKLVVNAITFNTDGTRFLALIRNMPRPGATHVHWQTVILTANTDGSEVHRLIGPGYASHYHWRDPGHVLFYAKPDSREKEGLYLFRDRSNEVELIDPNYFTFDGHCNYSPDRRFLLYDSYPDEECYRKLLLYDLRKRRGFTLATLQSDHFHLTEAWDIRCDLHPRWNREGTAISFDSFHENHRHIYRMDLTELVT
jgi:hypothetical protein